MKRNCLLLYLLINAVVFFIYGIDKRKAVKHRWRIPENTLIAAAILGVFGAYSGMHFFHHKTQKRRFYIGIPVIFVSEAAILLLLYLKI